MVRAGGEATPPFEPEAARQAPEPVDMGARAFGRYRLLYQIAAGGMATVYLGRSVGPGGFERPVAIKRIHPHLARRSEFVDMFLDEARIAARINHPNVCAIHDFGDVDGTYFIAMEYLVGVPVASLVRRVVEDPEVLESVRWRAMVAFLVREAAEGLHAAHELRADDGELLDVVHRDVSPQNLFVTFDGAVKVVDFGVAQARDRLHHTTTGTLKGKLAYMAPEHAGGLELDRRADVWSLGVVLFELLTGRRLFRRKNEMDTLLAVKSAPIPAPSSYFAGMPPALDAICARALSRDLEDRYRSCRELGRDLTAFLQAEDEPTSMAELSEWIRPLFPAEHTEQVDLVHTIMRSPLDELETAALGPDVTATVSERSGVRDLGPHAPMARPAPRRAGRAFALLGGVTVLALGMGALAGGWIAASPESPADRRTLPAVTATPPSAGAGELPAVPAPVPAEAAVVGAVAPGPAPLAEVPVAFPVKTSPAVRRPAGAPGTLSVSGRCWAQVFVGSRLLGQSPAQFPLPSGRQRVRVVPRGIGAGYPATVTIRPAEVTRLSVRCE